MRLTDHFNTNTTPWHVQKNRALQRVIAESKTVEQTHEIIEEECPNVIAKAIVEDILMRLKWLKKEKPKKYRKLIIEIRKEFMPIDEVSLSERKKIVVQGLTDKIDGFTQDKVEKLRADVTLHMEKFIKTQKLPDSLGQHSTIETLARALMLHEHVHLDHIRMHFMDEVVNKLYEGQKE